jgi:hypothetical protein
MSFQILVGSAAPATPAAGKMAHWFDSTDNRWKLKLSDGTVIVIQPYECFQNAIINGGHLYAQRQAPGTLTPYSTFAGGRKYAADRWGITGENDSVQYQRIDTSGAQETNLTARFYGKYKKLTSAGKVIVSQVIEGSNVMPYRGRSVRVQFKMKYSVAGSMPVRLGLLYLNSAGTIDTIPATFASAFGAVGTDPTWGTNLVALTPRQPDGGTVSGLGLTCILASGWTRFSAVFDIPLTCKNLIPLVWTNGQPAANDELNISEVQLNDGEEIMDWSRELASDELAKCQRFCWKTFDPDVAPAQNIGLNGALGGAIAAGAVVSTTPVQYPVAMLKAPTATFYNPSAANAFARNVPRATDATATSLANIGLSAADISITGLAAWVGGERAAVHGLFEAEL